MDDLSHWDFAKHFSGYDAAALILGLEPRESSDEQGRVRVVEERMELHYKQALTRLFHMDMGEPLEVVHGRESIDQQCELPSVKMEDLEYRAFTFNADAPLSEWIVNSRLTRFDNQEFSRETLVRWLSAIGMKSEYSFDLQRSPNASPTAEHWPWGTHHTELLGHLEAAARRFWTQYDPSDPSTANTNATVIEWLLTERKVSGKMAEAIATMLRPDGLRTGPR